MCPEALGTEPSRFSVESADSSLRVSPSIRIGCVMLMSCLPEAEIWIACCTIGMSFINIENSDFFGCFCVSLALCELLNLLWL